MSKQSDKRRYFPVGDVERVEYPCQNCNQGFYRYTPNGERIKKHNQMQHNWEKLIFLELWPQITANTANG